MKDLSVDQLERYLAKDSVQDALRRELISDKGTYKEFVKQLYKDIDVLIKQLQNSRHLRQGDSEDRITQDILIGLSQQGYTAIHDGNTGGHVDLLVLLNKHSWIAEAKKDGQFEEGLKQLTHRYVQGSGDFAHDHGGLLLYMVKTADALGSLNRWRSKVAKDGQACRSCKDNMLAFFSTHVLKGSGTRFVVRNMAVSLYHEPTDKSARRSAVRKGHSKSTSDS